MYAILYLKSNDHTITVAGYYMKNSNKLFIYNNNYIIVCIYYIII